jgi:hypothetical protein
MSGLNPAVGIAANYRQWSREARGLSPAYESLANAVADDRAVLDFLGVLPVRKRQPNLLFAAARYLLGRPAGIADLRRLATGSPAELSRLMLARSTQTNEPARCATLLPALAQLAEPLALIEVGASAGLTLLFDSYSYDYDGQHVIGNDRDAPTLRCGLRGPVPVPSHVPAIVWRAGLDLNPLDVTSDDDMRWLACLVWPDEGDRGERLTAAIAAARRDPPTVYRGDLRSDLPALAASAPGEATLVIYHSAVLAYLSPEDRLRFADTVRDLDCVWLANEAPGVVPGISEPDGYPGPGPFVLVRDGHSTLAITEGHGSWVHWL